MFFLLCTYLAFSQTISGYVFDAESNEPLESVAVYFDNTTVGTTTDSEGYFTLDYTDAIRSTLVCSYLGYESHYDNEYRSNTEVQITLNVNVDELDVVVIGYDDGLTRQQKLKLFRREFLGQSKFARSCKIMNEDDLILRYDKKGQSLSASSPTPVLIWNKDLNYQIAYDILDFQVDFKYVDLSDNYFLTNSVIYLGTSFFRDLNKTQKRRVLKRRTKVYKGSVQHFMRAVFNSTLSDENFDIYANSFQVNPWDYILVSDTKNPNYKKVQLNNRISILYNKERQSDLRLKTDALYIDSYLFKECSSLALWAISA